MAAGGPPIFDGEVMREFTRFPPPTFDLADVDAVRVAACDYMRQLASRPAEPREGVSVEDMVVPSAVDDHSIPVRVYRPDGVKPPGGGGLVYMHGGAFVAGDLDTEDENCYCWAREANCVVVSVGYRLAPEHPFPAALEDSYSVLLWVVANAEQLSIDPQRLGVGGCSAGGTLAAGVTLLCRDRGGPALVLQLLLCPILDAAMSSPSAAGMPEVEWRNAEQMWRHYLAGSERSQAPELASPASARDLTGLPPAFVFAAEHDVLRDEAIAYAQRLWAAGVSAELHVVPRVPHAFHVFAPDAGVARRSVSAQAAALADLLG